jgi:O-antigen ligase
MILPVIIYFFLFLLLSVRRLDLAVMILIFALPSYLIKFNIFGLPSTLLEIMILTIFAVWFLKNYKVVFLNLKSKILNSDSKINNDYPFKWEIIFFLLISFAAIGVGGFSNSALGIWKAYFFEPLLLFIIIINVFYKNGDFKKILWPLLFSALAVSLLAFYQKATGNLISNPFWAAAETRRAVSFFGYPNAVGLYLGPLILIFLGWLFSSVIPAKAGSRKEKTSFLIFHFFKFFTIILTIIFSLIAIYSARSEGALIGVGAALIIFSLLGSKKSRWTTLILVAILSLAIFSYPPARFYAFKKITLNDFSGQVRKAQWAETWKMLKDNRFIAGAGLANYQNAIAPYHQEGIFIKNDDPDFQKKVVFSAEYRKQVWQPLEIYLYPHNIFLNFWTEIGFLGMLLFAWIIIKFYYLNISLLFKNFDAANNKYILIGLIGAMTVIVIHGLVDVPYFKNDLAAMFWIFMAILGIIKLKYSLGGKEIKA